MKFISLTIILTSLLTLCKATANADEVAFVTALVSDYKAHPKDYINFIATATSVPAEVTHLAIKAATYKDDSYTTLLSTVDVGSLEDFATNLPWYSSRLADAANNNDDDKSSSKKTSSSSKSKTNVNGGAKSDNSKTTSAPDSSKSTFSTEITSTSSFDQKSYEDSTKSTPTGAAMSVAYVNMGAILGAIALVLM